MDLSGPLIRALAGADAFVDVLPHTVGQLPLGTLCFHETMVRVKGALPARATFTTWDPAKKAEEPRVGTHNGESTWPSVEYCARIFKPEAAEPEDLKDGSVHLVYCLDVLSQALLIVVTRKAGGAIVDDALATVTVSVGDRERSIEARKLAVGRWRDFPGVWQGARAGYLWPLELGFSTFSWACAPVLTTPRAGGGAAQPHPDPQRDGRVMLCPLTGQIWPIGAQGCGRVRRQCSGGKAP